MMRYYVPRLLFLGEALLGDRCVSAGILQFDVGLDGEYEFDSTLVLLRSSLWSCPGLRVGS